MRCKRDEQLTKEKQTCTTNEKQKIIKKLKNEYEKTLKIKEEMHNDEKIRGEQRREKMQQKWHPNK
jgi:hypothetical protein